MNCRWLEVVLLLAIIIFALAVEWSTAKWLIFVAALILIIHSIWCNSCSIRPMPRAERPSSRSRSRRRR